MSDTPRTDAAEITDDTNVDADYVYSDFARQLERELTAASEKVAALQQELETERMRLVACDVIAMANTKESAEKARSGIHPDYLSPALTSVMRAVDAEISARDKVAALQDRVKELEAQIAGHEKDTERLDLIADEYLKLDCFDMPTGEGDADVGWRVSNYHQAKPCERVVAEVYHDNPRDALDEAREALFKESVESVATLEDRFGDIGAALATQENTNG